MTTRAVSSPPAKPARTGSGLSPAMRALIVTLAKAAARADHEAERSQSPDEK
jgi:hypothetical protein